MECNDIEKIDVHMHYSTIGVELLEQAIKDKFSLISINTDVPFYDNIRQQEKCILDLNSIRLNYIATFEMAKWGEPEWIHIVLNQIKLSIENGAIAIKFWKNIGMDIKDKNDKHLMIDHPSFDPIFEYLIANKIPAVGHLGEPKNCWLHLDEMTINSDREYFAKHPEYHMALLPNFPTYKEQMEARDNVLKKHPKLIFIGAHMASLEWSTDVLGAWFDKFPNALIDLAARVCHLQLQAQNNWKKVRDFMIKYQDRIMYGSDIIYDNQSDVVEIKERAHQLWKNEWDFFATNKEMEVPQFDGKFNGIALPDKVIIKIYRDNAYQIYLNLKIKKRSYIQ